MYILLEACLNTLQTTVPPPFPYPHQPTHHSPSPTLLLRPSPSLLLTGCGGYVTHLCPAHVAPAIIEQSAF